MSDRQRLDHYVSHLYPNISRGFLQKLIANGEVTVNGQPEKSGFRLKDDDTVEILYDLASVGVVPDIDIPIVYEDDNVLVIDKPTGVLSHALTKFHNEASVASFLRQKLAGTTEDGRFGIVHRLDRLTSGIMICAKNHETMRYLQKQFADRAVKKTYVAIVSGVPKLEQAVLDWPIERNPKSPARFRVGPNGKPSQTEYKLMKTNQKYSQLELHPLTGRTHQLRVHLQHLKHSIVGDQLYDGEEADRLYLHAHSLTIKLPGDEKRVFTATLPKQFTKKVS